jgi:hypothetical protein
MVLLIVAVLACVLSDVPVAVAKSTVAGRDALSWSTPYGGFNGAESAPASAISPSSVVHLRMAWSKQLGSSSFVASSRDLVSGSKEYRIRDGRVVRILGNDESAITGSTIISLTGQPARPAYLQARSLATGRLIWSRNFNAVPAVNQPGSVATVGDNEVLVTTDYRTIAFSLRSGHRDWTRHFGGVGATYGHGRFYVPAALFGQDAHIVAAHTGRTLVGSVWPGSGGPFMVTKNTVLFIPAGSLELVAISPYCHRSPCKARWTRELPNYSTLATGDGRVVTDDLGAAGRSPRSIAVYNVRTGQRIAHVHARGISGSTVIAHDLILRYVDTTGTLQALRLNHPGDVVWSRKLSADTDDASGEIAVLKTKVLVDAPDGSTTELDLY